MTYMFQKLKKNIKLLPGLLTLVGLLLTSSIFYRNAERSHKDTNINPVEKKDKKIASLHQNNSNNSFLFVDCTGFFE